MTTTAAKFEQYRQDVRRTFQRMSDQALAYQSGVIRGGIDREECDRELARRQNVVADGRGGWVAGDHGPVGRRYDDTRS